MIPYKLLLTLLFLPFISKAQHYIIENQDSLKQYLLQDTFAIDPDAAAIILHEKSTTHYQEGYSTYTIEHLVKVLSPEAISELSTINIPSEPGTRILHIKAVTFNWEGNTINKQDVDSANIITEKMYENNSVVKFNLPSVQKGSLVYCTVTITSPGLSVYGWVFQNTYPTLYSRYELTLPGNINHAVRGRFTVTPFVAKRKEALDTCTACLFKTTNGDVYSSTTETWVRRNLKALADEPFMGFPHDYIDRIKIDFGWRNQTWDEIIRYRLYNTIFYAKHVFTPNPFLNKTIKRLCQDKNTELEKAKAIYAFVRDSIAEERYTKRTKFIKQVFKTRLGNPTKKTLLLTAMLRKAGLNAVPAITKAKPSEPMDPEYPTLNGNILTLTELTLEGKSYFLYPSLDLPFGILPVNFYNGYGRTVEQVPRPVLLSPDSARDKTNILISLSPTDSTGNTLLLKLGIQYGLYSGHALRSQWLKDSLEIKKEATRLIDDNIAQAKMRSVTTKNLESLDAPLSLHIETSMDLVQGNNYLQPMFAKFIEANPFPSKDRQYPIEMNFLQDYTYTFLLTLPDHFTLEDVPAPVTLRVGQDKSMEMKTLVNYDSTDNRFTMQAKFVSQRATFLPEEYQDLRSFFEGMIEQQNKRIILMPKYIQ